MPSNRELTEEAEALGKALGVTVETKGLNNSKLTELVASLKTQAEAKVEVSVEKPSPEVTPEPQPAPPPVVAPRAPQKEPALSTRYVVAKGKSIVVLRGVLGPGEEVRASDMTPEALLNLVTKKYVDKS